MHQNKQLNQGQCALTLLYDMDRINFKKLIFHDGNLWKQMREATQPLLEHRSEFKRITESWTSHDTGRLIISLIIFTKPSLSCDFGRFYHMMFN